MTWNNLALVPATDNWQYTEPFVGDYVRIRHLLGADKRDLPYGFVGLLAQAFDFANTVELFEIVRIYPYNQEDIFKVVNPFPNQERRLAIRGQRKYETNLNWQMVIDYWNAPEAPDNSEINQSLEEIKQRLSRLPIIEAKIDLILEKLGATDDISNTEQQFYASYFYGLL